MKITEKRTVTVQVDVTDDSSDDQYDAALGATALALGVGSGRLIPQTENQDGPHMVYVWEVVA